MWHPNGYINYLNVVIRHELNKCWNVVNSNFRNKLQRNLKRNSYIFIQENAFEYIICECNYEIMNDSCKQQILNSLNICDWNHVKETNDAQEAYSKFS